MKSLFRCSIEADHSAVPICHPGARRAQRRSRRAVGPRAMARLVLDRSEHAGMPARSKEVILALDSQHGIYRDPGPFPAICRTFADRPLGKYRRGENVS